VLEGVDNAIDAVNAYRDNPAGTIRLTVHPLAAVTVIAPLVAPLPGAVPAMFDGLRVSAAYAVAAAAIAEQIGGARSGIGLYITRSQRSFRADQVLAGVVVIAVLSLVVYTVVSVCAQRAAPWHVRATKEPA